MSQPGTTAPAPNPFQVTINTLNGQLQSDSKGYAKQMLTTFFTNIQSNPNPTNVMAQGALLQATALLNLPNLTQEVIGQIAGDALVLIKSW